MRDIGNRETAGEERQIQHYYAVVYKIDRDQESFRWLPVV
jgi:hypothetical protein